MNNARSVAPSWTFLTNHTHILVVLARDRDATVQDLSARVGISERAVLRIIGELEDAGYLERERRGRRNTYRLRLDLPCRHALERHCTVAHLIEVILGEVAPSALKDDGGS